MYDSALLDEYLCHYYKNLYPVKWIMKWLSYGKEAKEGYLARREIAFILEGDRHIRYLSFENEHEMLKELGSKKPHKVDIGAVYNHKPKEHKAHIDFKAMERELVFDIDLTDYDPFRKCCKGTNVCQKCWRWIVIAVRVLDQLLREHFGFRHLLWVFSGRRGIHCWVADDKARKLTNAGRTAVAKYLSYDSAEPPFTKYHIHPMAATAYRAMMDSDEMDKLITEQGWLDNSDGWGPILRLCKDQALRDSLEEQFHEVPSAVARWTILKRRFDSKEREQARKKGDFVPSEVQGDSKRFLMQFVFAYAYPKLDVNVSTGTNHLLKSPFCVHPKTGMVAVPLSPKTIQNVKLANIPRVDNLISEMSKIKAAAESEDQENRKTLYYKHTSLAPYVEIFEAFVNAAIAQK